MPRRVRWCGRASAPHPDGTEVDPGAWWEAYRAASAGLLAGVEAIAVAGQQHGMVALDAGGEVIRPALLWNDTRSARGRASNSSPSRRRSVGGGRGLGTRRQLHRDQAALARPQRAGPGPATDTVLLPHDWLTWRLRDRPDAATTDRGDASGTGYWSPRSGEYRLDLLAAAFGRELTVPRVPAPAEPAGMTPDRKTGGCRHRRQHGRGAGARPGTG